MAEMTVTQNLIPVETRAIGAAACQAVNARELHSYLDVKKDFTDWIKAQIERGRLKENRDFLVFPQKGENGGRPKIEYFLTIEAAKHIAMMSGTDKGYEAREYFLECERRAIAAPAITAADMAQTLRDFAQLVGVKLDEHGRVIQHVSARVDTVEQRMESGFQHIDSRFDDIETRLIKRANFSRRARALFTQTVHRFYGGICPCCQETRILSAAGQPLMDVLRFDHWNGKQHNMISHGWAVCVTCNRDLERKRHEKHIAFALFQQNLERVQALHGLQLELPLIDSRKAA